ncbi:MAG: ABC transporter permease [Acidimicrobiia bacterium]
MKVRRLLLNLAAPVGAVAFALAVSSIFLVVSGNSPIDAYTEMASFGSRVDSLVSATNRAIPLYFSAMAVAIGFKMGLFNIGVEGQYRIAVIIAAAVGGAVALPGVLHIALIMLVAMAVGSVWAGIAGVLKVKRGVHEVISTIMLNFIATGLGAYLLATYLRQENPPGDLIIKTAEIPKSGQFPSLNPLLEAVGLDPGRSELHGFVIIAVLAGIGYHLVVQRTRFGYDLRATGINPGAAQAGGVDPGAMVIKTMLLGGAVAGLVGMSLLLGFFHRYTLDFPTFLGFSGITVALLGRNHPVGMALGALLFGWLERSAQILDLKGIPKEIVTIILGIVVLSVVIAYEIARRRIETVEVREAAAAAAGRPPPSGWPSFRNRRSSESGGGEPS